MNIFFCTVDSTNRFIRDSLSLPSTHCRRLVDAELPKRQNWYVYRNIFFCAVDSTNHFIRAVDCSSYCRRHVSPSLSIDSLPSTRWRYDSARVDAADTLVFSSLNAAISIKSPYPYKKKWRTLGARNVVVRESLWNILSKVFITRKNF